MDVIMRRPRRSVVRRRLGGVSERGGGKNADLGLVLQNYALFCVFFCGHMLRCERFTLLEDCRLLGGHKGEAKGISHFLKA